MGDQFDQYKSQPQSQAPAQQQGDTWDQYKVPMQPQTPKPTIVSESGRQVGSLLNGLKEMVVGPPLPAQQTTGAILRGLVNTGKDVYNELAGNPAAGKSVLTAPTSWLGTDASPYGRLEGALSTFLGGDPAAARANYAAGNKSASLGDMYAVPVATLGAGKLVKSVLPEVNPSLEKRSMTLSRAADSATGKADIPAAFKTALPDLLQTQKLTGNPTDSPQKLAQLIKDTGARTQTEYGMAMRPIANQQVVPIQISDALKSAAVDYHTGRAADEQMAKSLESAATEFEKPYTYSQLDQVRMNARRRINSVLSKKPSQQSVDIRTDPETAIESIVNDGAKDTIYDALEAHHGAPDYFRQLKQRQAAMFDLNDQMDKRMKDLSNNAPYDTFMDRVRGHSYMSSGGHFGMALGNVLGAPFPEQTAAFGPIEVEGKVNRAVRKGMTTQPRTGVAKAVTGAGAAARNSQDSLAPDDTQ